MFIILSSYIFSSDDHITHDEYNSDPVVPNSLNTKLPSPNTELNGINVESKIKILPFSKVAATRSILFRLTNAVTAF